jgi:hypothetical protein
MRASIMANLFRGALVVALSAVGCGGSNSGGAGNKDQFIAQLCAEFAGCCQAAGRPADGAQCRAFYGAFTSSANYDAAASNACLNEIRAQGDTKCLSSSMSTPSCRKVFSSAGTKQPGEACDDVNDCALSDAGLVDCVSAFQNGATVQQCQLRLRGEAGSTPCVGTVNGNITTFVGEGDAIPATGYLCNIADGVSCDGQSGACTALSASGSACHSSSACVLSAYCDFGQSMCKDRVALGAACSTSEACAETAYCEQSSKTCVARHATGETCTTSNECISDNCTNQKCGAKDDLELAFLCGSN